MEENIEKCNKEKIITIFDRKGNVMQTARKGKEKYPKYEMFFHCVREKARQNKNVLDQWQIEGNEENEAVCKINLAPIRKDLKISRIKATMHNSLSRDYDDNSARHNCDCPWFIGYHLP